MSSVPLALKAQLTPVIRRYLPGPDYRAFVFGSRIRGTGTERSDIDIGIEGPSPLPVRAKLDLEDALEHLPTLLKFDVVDFATVDPDFKERAKEFIEYL